MILATLLFPYASTSLGWGGSSEGHWVDMAIFAITWTFYPVSENSNPLIFDQEGYGFYFLDPLALFSTFPIWFLSAIFAIQIVRYRMGKADGKKTRLLGIISLILPAIYGVMGLPAVVQAGVLAYVGPIPLQFLVGYILLRYSTYWEPESPFEQADSESWWEKEENNE
ncbi:MAG: hypothetical protein ACXAB6_08700 [Candidatus Thorarchaeota archaeon]|jgi:hypothetical protein